MEKLYGAAGRSWPPNRVMCSPSLECMICVLRVSSACTVEMPMLLPMFRSRLNMEVPPERNCGASVAKDTVVSGA